MTSVGSNFCVDGRPHGADPLPRQHAFTSAWPLHSSRHKWMARNS